MKLYPGTSRTRAPPRPRPNPRSGRARPTRALYKRLFFGKSGKSSKSAALAHSPPGELFLGKGRVRLESAEDCWLPADSARRERPETESRSRPIHSSQLIRPIPTPCPSRDRRFWELLRGPFFRDPEEIPPDGCGTILGRRESLHRPEPKPTRARSIALPHQPFPPGRSLSSHSIPPHHRLSETDHGGQRQPGHNSRHEDHHQTDDGTHIEDTSRLHNWQHPDRARHRRHSLPARRAGRLHTEHQPGATTGGGTPHQRRLARRTAATRPVLQWNHEIEMRLRAGPRAGPLHQPTGKRVPIHVIFSQGPPIIPKTGQSAPTGRSRSRATPRG